MSQGKDSFKRNPCSWKEVCKKCIAVRLSDRPSGCQDQTCRDYTPCSLCGSNKTLLADGLCKACSKENPYARPEPSIDGGGSSQNASSGNEGAFIDDVRSSYEVTSPGTPPSNYTPDEKVYYVNQWNSYSGYYRDPTVNTIIHQLIILEIELNFWSAYRIRTRGDAEKMADDKVSKLLSDLKVLRSQLPEKDALDANEEETALSVIYQKYLEEKAKIEKGGIKRVFSPQAIALAPVLRYPVDLKRILRYAGYQEIDALSAIDKLKSDGNLPSDPLELALFFGFPINEETVSLDTAEEPETMQYGTEHAIDTIDDDLTTALDSMEMPDEDSDGDI